MGKYEIGKGSKKLRAVLSLNLENMEMDEFMWTEDRDPPPLIRPKIKKKGKDESEEERRPGS